ncbi:MAG TPA: hypothetical protein VIW24_05620 [Aldersonia sp.]
MSQTAANGFPGLLPVLRALRAAKHPAATLGVHESDLLDAGGVPESPLALADRTARMRSSGRFGLGSVGSGRADKDDTGYAIQCG